MIDTWLSTWPDLDIWFCTDWLYYFLFMILIIQLSFIFSLSCCCTHCLYTRALHFSYTLIRSFLTILNLHVHILDMLYFSDQVFDELVHVARSLEFLPIFWYSCLLFIPVSVLFLILVYQIQSLFQFFIYMISCVDVCMWYCSDRWFIIV